MRTDQRQHHFWNNLGLRFWLGMSYGLLVAALVVAVGALVEGAAARHAEREVGAALEREAQTLARRVDEALRERLNDMRTLATLPLPAMAADDPAAVRRVFSQMASQLPDYAWLGLSDAEGRVLVALDGMLEGADVSQRPWFAGGLDSPFVGDVHEAQLLANLLAAPADAPLRFVDVAAPVVDAAGQPVGVVAAHLHWRWVQGLKRELEPIGLAGGGAELLLVAEDRIVLLGPEAMQGLELPLPVSDPATGSDAGRHWRARWPDGREYLGAGARTRGEPHFQSLGWTVLVRQPVDQALAPLRDMRNAVMLWSLPLALAGVLAAVLLGRWIGKPLRRINLDARRIRRREGAMEVADPGGYREARELASSLGSLIADVTRRETELTELADTLEHRVADRTRELETLNAQLEEMALRDALTGVANRRCFVDELDGAVARAVEQGLPLSLLMIDVDHFKQVNDTHGHPAGDAVLHWLAGVAASQVRGTDLLARTGGEEFAVLAIDTPSGEAMALAERLREAVQVRGPVSVGRVAVEVTVSIGMASIEYLKDELLLMDPGTIASQLVADADAALYRAKSRGRNRVQSA